MIRRATAAAATPSMQTTVALLRGVWFSPRLMPIGGSPNELDISDHYRPGKDGVYDQETNQTKKSLFLETMESVSMIESTPTQGEKQ